MEIKKILTSIQRIRSNFTEPFETIIEAFWRTKPIWFRILEIIYGILSTMPFWTDAMKVIPGYWWVIVYLLIISGALFDYATRLRLKPLREFRKFIKTRLLNIDELLKDVEIDEQKERKIVDSLDRAFMEVLREDFKEGDFERHYTQFKGCVDRLRKDGSARLIGELRKNTLRDLRRFAERLRDTSSSVDLMPEFDGCVLKQIKKDIR